jgi:hypothetical protein
MTWARVWVPIFLRWAFTLALLVFVWRQAPWPVAFAITWLFLDFEKRELEEDRQKLLDEATQLEKTLG